METSERRFWWRYFRRGFWFLMLSFVVSSAVRSVSLLVVLSVGYVAYGIHRYVSFRRTPSQTELELDAVVAALERAELSPVRIQIRENIRIRWFNPAEVDRLTKDFLSLGFLHIGDFSIDQKSGTDLRAFYHPVENFQGEILAGKGRAIVSMGVRLEDGTDIVISNRKPRVHRWCPPWLLQIDEEGADLSQVNRLLVQHVGEKARVKVDPGQYKQNKEERVNEMVKSWVGRGGTRREDLERIRTERGSDWSDEMFETLVLYYRRQNLRMLEQMHVQNFFISGQMSQEKAVQVKDRLVIVHDRFEKDEVPWPPGTMEPALLVPQGVMSMREAFRIVNSSLPAEDRDQLLGSVELPIPADLYVRPTHLAIASEER